MYICMYHMYMHTLQHDVMTMTDMYPLVSSWMMPSKNIFQTHSKF